MMATTNAGGGHLARSAHVDRPDVRKNLPPATGSRMVVSFLGRRGTYRYLDMDATIAEALDVADQLKAVLSAGVPTLTRFGDATN